MRKDASFVYEKEAPKIPPQLFVLGLTRLRISWSSTLYPLCTSCPQTTIRALRSWLLNPFQCFVNCEVIQKKKQITFFFWAHRSRQSSGVFNDAHLGFKKENQEGEAKESMAEIASFPRGGGWGSVWVWGCQNVLKVTWKKTVFFRLLKPAYQHLPGWLRADSNNQDSKYVCVCDGGRSAAEAILPSWFND